MTTTLMKTLHPVQCILIGGEQLSLVMSQEEGSDDRLLRLCVLISEKVTPRGERKKTHHRHIWKEQS